MESNFAASYTSVFRELINVADEDDMGALWLGLTRKCELDGFVDLFMANWTQEYEKSFMLPQMRDNGFWQKRFCTFPEFQVLFQQFKAANLNSPVFKVLGIVDEGTHNGFKRHFTDDRDGYFKLMDIHHPQMRAFFFQTVPCKDKAAA